MTTSTHTIAHVRVETPKAFAEVARAFERELGAYDAAVFQAFRAAPPVAEEGRARLEAMAGHDSRKPISRAHLPRLSVRSDEAIHPLRASR